jgi:hypothetical protein
MLVGTVNAGPGKERYIISGDWKGKVSVLTTLYLSGKVVSGDRRSGFLIYEIYSAIFSFATFTQNIRPLIYYILAKTTV